MKRFDLITLGGATEDVTALVDDFSLLDNSADPIRSKLIAFEYGAKVGLSDLHSSFGGGASNAAVAAARLGLKVAAHISLGHDNRGDRILRNMVAHKIDTRFIARSKGESGLSFIIKTPTHEHILFTHRGANDYLEINRKLSIALRKAKRVYISSLSGSWRGILKQIAETKARIAWNPGRLQLLAGYSVLRNFLQEVEILVLNKDEATELLISKPGVKKSSYSRTDLLRALSKMGPKLVLITEGGKGASLICDNKIYQQKSVAKKVVDTTGVGDAFAATFISYYDKHQDIARALRAAAKNAASVIGKAGAQNGLKTKSELGI